MALNPGSLRVVQEIGARNPNFVTGGDKSQITVLVCTSAAGYAIPPYIIFTGSLGILSLRAVKYLGLSMGCPRTVG